PSTSTSASTPSQGEDGVQLGQVFPVHLDGLDQEDTFNGALQVPYWFDGEIVDTDGSTTPWPTRPYRFAKEDGGWAVIQPGSDGAEMVRIDVAGKPLADPLPSFEQGLAVGPGGAVATITKGADSWV